MKQNSPTQPHARISDFENKADSLNSVHCQTKKLYCIVGKANQDHRSLSGVESHEGKYFATKTIRQSLECCFSEGCSSKNTKENPPNVAFIAK